MPFYDFKCIDKKCKNVDEHMMKVSEYEEKKENMKCSKCKGKSVLVISLPHFRLVGGGWARDQYTNHWKNENKAALDEYDKHQKVSEKTLSKEQNIQQI